MANTHKLIKRAKDQALGMELEGSKLLNLSQAIQNQAKVLTGLLALAEMAEGSQRESHLRHLARERRYLENLLETVNRPNAASSRKAPSQREMARRSDEGTQARRRKI